MNSELEGTLVPVNTVIDEYNDFVDNAMKFNYFSVSKEIQRDKIEECKNALLKIKQYKAQAVDDRNEHYANVFFYMQCMVNAMISSLSVWVKVKEGKYQKAWTRLVDAMEYLEVALKIDNERGTNRFLNHLKSMEDCLFPGWPLFNSTGIVERGSGKCSICSLDFSTCDHLEGNIYFGRLCRRVDRDIHEINHIALVEEPQDKRCVITVMTDDAGICTDHFTKETTQEEKTGSTSFRSVVLTTREMDFS